MSVMTPSGATKRVQLHRLRKQIDAISKDAGWSLAALQTFYEEMEIQVSTWISADEFYAAEITPEDLLVNNFYASHYEFLEYLNDDAGIEKTTLRSGTNDVLLIRPKFLGEALNQ